MNEIKEAILRSDDPVLKVTTDGKGEKMFFMVMKNAKSESTKQWMVARLKNIIEKMDPTVMRCSQSMKHVVPDEKYNLRATSSAQDQTTKI